MFEKRDSIEKSNQREVTKSCRKSTIFLRSKSTSTNSNSNLETGGDTKEDAIINSFINNEDKKDEKRLNGDLIKYAIEKIYNGKYGTIDLDNDQHLELLYWYISHISKCFPKDSQSPSHEQVLESEHEKWQKEKLASPDVQNTYKTAFIGAGASIAYYIESLGKNFDHTESIIIGTPQPFGGKRGPGFIVHPENMVTPKRQFASETEISDRWMNRKDFSQSIEKSLEASKIEKLEELVKKVEKIDRFYRITYGKKDKEKYIYAKDVIMGMGVGGHALRNLKENQVAKNDEEAEVKRIMDVDIFNRVGDRLREKTAIIVAGGNGLIGNIFDAIQDGYSKIEWIAGKNKASFYPGQTPYAVYLPYLKYLSSIEKDPNQKEQYSQEIQKLKLELETFYQVQDKKEFKNVLEKFDKFAFKNIHFENLGDAIVEKTESEVIITLSNGQKVEGKYLVYARGQDFSTFELLDEEIRQNLETDDDRNRRFPQSDKELSTLGLKSKDDPTGCSLKIIGAAAYHMASLIKAEHNMKQAIQSWPHNISSNDVLTAIRGQIEAVNNFMPYDINEWANFITDDRTMLAVHISAKYPTIADHKSPVSAKEEKTDRESSAPFVGLLTEMIIRSRRQKGIKSEPDSLLPAGPDILPYPPNGCAFQEYWEGMLSNLEKFLQQKKKSEVLRL